MSIVQILEDRVRRGLLIKLPSRWGDLETPRDLYVLPQTAETLNIPDDDAEDNLRLVELLNSLVAFVEHNEMTVSEDPDCKPSKVMMARVKPVEDEFWSIRVTEPEDYAGIRALGGFVDRDRFVVLTWDYREAIADAFDQEVELARATWRDLFGQAGPLKGENLDAYLTNYLAV